MRASARLDERVDGYIAKARQFAQPVLEHLRELVHRGCPQVEETMKWSRPFFVYREAILGNMSAFQAHCSFGFWGAEMGPVLREAGAVRGEAMGSLGRITRVEDLPADKLMVGWVRQAAGFIASRTSTSPMVARRVVKAPRAAVAMPAEFVAALAQDARAGAVFAGFSASCQREYTDWIAEAKRPETRAKRIVQAVGWLGEGKRRHWKYEEC